MNSADIDSNIENTYLFKKVLGCLAIGAIGDNLGRPVEGWHYKNIIEKYGVSMTHGLV